MKKWQKIVLGVSGFLVVGGTFEGYYAVMNVRSVDWPTVQVYVQESVDTGRDGRRSSGGRWGFLADAILDDNSYRAVCDTTFRYSLDGATYTYHQDILGPDADTCAPPGAAAWTTKVNPESPSERWSDPAEENRQSVPVAAALVVVGVMGVLVIGGMRFPRFVPGPIRRFFEQFEFVAGSDSPRGPVR